MTLVGTASCGGNNGADPDARADRPGDTAPEPDRWTPAQTVADGGGPAGCLAIGSPCDNDGDCCAPLSCIELQTGLRLCTRGCRNDLPTTPLVDEDDCPDGTRCTRRPGDVVCLPLCQPTAGVTTCPAGAACRPESAALLGEGDLAACAYPACTVDADCPVLLDSACVVGAVDACAHVSADAFCVPEADVAGDYGRCALAGTCDVPSGLCRSHTLGRATARIGDPCADDRDCGGQMRCLREARLSTTRALWRNGYCTIDGCAFAATLPERGCPTGSTCYRLEPGGRCLMSCDPTSPDSCRGQPDDRHGDYECYSWQYFRFSAQQAVSDLPVCDCPELPIYQYFKQVPQLGCSSLGPAGNTTQMACRDPLTGQILPDGSADCLCLDLTAAGPLP